MGTGGKPIEVTEDEITLLVEALDSHEYWQLSESHERNDGYSTIEDGENAEVDAVRALIGKLEGVRQESPVPIRALESHAHGLPDHGT